jgi:hypothetical protein
MHLEDRNLISDTLCLSPLNFDIPVSKEIKAGEVIESLGTKTSQRSRRNSFGGRVDLMDAYRNAKDLIIKHKLFRLCQLIEIGDTKQLIICNLWKIERFSNNTIKTYEFLLNSDEWIEVEKLEYWPEVPFWPVTNKSLDWWRQIAKAAIWKALIAVGYFSLPHYLTKVDKWEIDEKGNSIPSRRKKEMPRHRMAYQLITRYIGTQGKYDTKKNKYEWKDGYLKSDSMMAGARALRAAVYHHILEKEVLSAVLAIDYKYVPFVGYLTYAKHRVGLLKVRSEHRNFLPMLPRINPAQWERADLFSRKLWVKGERKSTVVDRRGFGLEQPGGGINKDLKFVSFDTAAGYRWLSKASSVVIKEWVSSGRKNPNVIVNMALANVNARVPVLAYQHLIRSKRYAVSPVIQHVYRLFLMHCSKLWEEKGFVEVKKWVRADGQSNISNMMDYLEFEGFEQGQPDKQATWPSLVRRSDDWHARIAITNMESELAGQKILEWNSAVPETVIEGITFTSLNTSREVAVEGYEMHHCVGQYTRMCHTGKYRVYSVLEPDGSRSTLGFGIKGKKALWDQHMSKYNGSISPAAHAAGLKLATLYQQKIQT